MRPPGSAPAIRPLPGSGPTGRFEEIGWSRNRPRSCNEVIGIRRGRGPRTSLARIDCEGVTPMRRLWQLAMGAGSLAAILAASGTVRSQEPDKSAELKAIKKTDASQSQRIAGVIIKAE